MSQRDREEYKKKTTKLDYKYFTCKSRSQLAQEYGVSRRTLYTWFKSENLSFNGKILKPIELKEIYERFGMPDVGMMIKTV